VGTDSAFIINNQASDVLTIKNGNVGIGTTSPAAPLHIGTTNSIGPITTTNVMSGAAIRVGGTSQWGGQILIGSSEGNNYFWYQTGKWDAANSVLNPNYALAINPLGGNVGIGTTTPTEKLDVNGNVQATAFLYSSDERLKTNIEKISNSGILRKMQNINMIKYTWKDKTKDQSAQIGFIAQEIEKEFSELVHTNADGYKSVDYPKMTVLLLGAIKELQAEVDTLKAQSNP